MFSRFGKSKKGKLANTGFVTVTVNINTEETLHLPYAEGNRFTGSEKELKTKKISRRAQGKNNVQVVHSDCDEELQSEALDNPHLYTRTRSSVRYFELYWMFFNFFYI